MKFLIRHFLLISVLVVVTCAAAIFLIYIYLEKPPWALELYNQVEAKFRCNPPSVISPFDVKIEAFLPSLEFDRAVQLRQDKRNLAVWYIAEHQGKIFKVEKGSKTLFLDITDRVKMGSQWGLQGFALHPDFPNNPRIAITYTSATPSPDFVLESRLAVFFGDRDKVDPDSEVVVFRDQQKNALHPVAGVEFAPDGNLLVAWGEASNAHPRTLRGKLLRINIDSQR